MTWPVVELGDLSLTIRNGIFARRPTDEPVGSRILRISAVRDGRVNLDDTRYVKGLEPAQIGRFSIETGDLLITRYNGSRALVGTSGLVPELDGPVIHPDKLIRVVLDRDRVDPAFVNYQLQSNEVRAYLEPRIRTTAGQSGIAGADVRSLPLVLPPLDEQRRIVEVLEDHFSRLDAADAYLQAMRRRLDAMERAELDRLFGGAEIPLVELIESISAGKSFGRANAPAGDDEWGIIKVSAMTWGRFDPTENKAVPADRVDQRFEIREGDLLVSRANTDEYVGASVLVGPVRSKLLLSDKSLRVTPHPGVRVDWLWRALQAPSARRQISAMATGTKESMRNISQDSLKRILLPRANPEGQAAAVKAFAESAAAIGRLRTALSASQVRSGSLRRSLLAAAFSGRLTGDGTALPRARELVIA